MDAWGRDDIPGSASQRTRLEGAEVVDEVGDDHLRDFMGEGVNGFMHAARHWRCITEEVIDLGFALMPDVDHTNQEVCPYGVKSRSLEPLTSTGEGASRGTEEVVIPGRFTSVVVGGVIVMEVRTAL